MCNIAIGVLPNCKLLFPKPYYVFVYGKTGHMNYRIIWISITVKLHQNYVQIISFKSSQQNLRQPLFTLLLNKSAENFTW